ncbi:MAG: hypothetical protein ACR2JT_00555 [Nocardioidaceae bacterium]
MPISPMTATDYVFLPVMGFALIGLFVLVLRWAHRPAERRSGRPLAGEHGVLVPVTTVRDSATAAHLVAVLRSAGIQATTTGSSAEMLLLVWPSDAEAARDRLVELSREKG